MICVLFADVLSPGWVEVREYIPGPQISSAFSFAARSVLLRTTSCWKGSPEARPLCSEYQKNNHSSRGGGTSAGETWFMIGCSNPLMPCTERTLRSCQTPILGEHEIDACFCFRYLTLVESVPTYGVHYYEVKVKTLPSVCTSLITWHLHFKKLCKNHWMHWIIVNCSFVLFVTRHVGHIFHKIVVIIIFIVTSGV